MGEHLLCRLQIKIKGTWTDHVPSVQGSYSFCLGWKRCLMFEQTKLSRIVPVKPPRLSAEEECGPFNPENQQ